MPTEIEKKYRLTPTRMEEIGAALFDYGAEYCGEAFEENTLFSNHILLGSGAIVRIRKTEARSTLTFKKRQHSRGDAKQHLEFESEIADPVCIGTILENIGLEPVLVYEKKRKTYRLRNAEVVLDELPFGSFMEIEGSLTAIAEAELLLGLEDLPVEYETYPRLTARLGVKNGTVVESRFG